MTSWFPPIGMLAFDVESTGVDVEYDRIVTATAAMLRPAPTPPWQTTISSWLIAPDIDIPAEATAIHGIETIWAKEHGQLPPEALDPIAGELALAVTAGVPIVGCNLAYDLTILDRELRRYLLPTLEERIGGPIRPVLDCYVLDKAVQPYRKGSRKLTALAEHYGVELVGAHDATADALAAARIVYRIGQRSVMSAVDLRALGYEERDAARLRDLGQMRMVDVHDAQIGWRAEQQASLAAYFRRTGKSADDVDGSWPMRPWPEQARLEYAGG